MRTFFALTVFAISLLSCSNNRCIEELVGTYVGTESCPDTDSDVTLTLFENSSISNSISGIINNSQVIASPNGENIDFLGFIGCGEVIIIQSFLSSGLIVPETGQREIINGDFTVSDNSIEGSLTFSALESTCSYTFTRQ